MICANNEFNVKHIAWETEKNKGPFFCPECNSEVMLRKGKIREHHFAHKPPINCIYGSGESQEHLRIKKELYTFFSDQNHCENCEIERSLKGVRPDISLCINKNPIAIEIQKSTITIDEIIRRTTRYTELGIALLWIIPGGYPNTIFHENSGQFIHRIKEWELFIHSLYYGRIYYWTKRNKVRAIHFGKVMLEKKSAEWYEPGGNFVSVGGYEHVAKRLRTIEPLNDELEIDIDFKIFNRDLFKTKNWVVPQSKIYMDKKKKWW